MTIRVDLYLKLVLTAIALLLGVSAFQPVPVRAEMEMPNLYVEPGLTRIPDPKGGRETMGKMVVDLKTGDAWGFPTIFSTGYEPAVSKPVYLGRFDFAAMKRK